MKAARVIYHLARADFLERVRRYSFLVMLAGTIYLGYSINRGDMYLELEGYRGVLNSAWVGGMMTASAGILLTLFGFYLVKNTIERDIHTGVGQIIAATPISRPVYLLGKWLSNFAVLSALLGLLALAAAVMQLLGGESARLDPWALFSPFILVGLPTLAVTAALAVLFETIAWLRGGFGNVAYFFIWTFALTGAFLASTPWLDWSGIILIAQSMGAALRQVYPAYTIGFSLTFQALPAGGLKTFEWLGIQWSAETLASRLLWLAAALGLVLLGSLSFRRFDPAYERIKPGKKPSPKVENGPGEAMPAAEPAAAPLVHLRHLAPITRRFGFARILAAELRLLLKGLPWWWYAGAAGLIAASLFNSVAVVKLGLLPAAWIWPMLVWSGLGCRETRHGTRQIVFSAPHPLSRQLPAAWLAGFLVTALAGSGAMLRLLLAGDFASLLACLAAALFIPSLALALGVWSGSSKAFEVVYLLWWYLGPLHPRDAPALDFTGAVTSQYWPTYLILALALFGAAVLGRKLQIAT